MIFDLDGTLVESIEQHKEAWQETFHPYGITLTPDELGEQSGKKNTLFIAIILERRNRTDLDPQALSREKDEKVIEILQRKPAIVYPHAKELLQLFHSKGIWNVLATSSTKRTGYLLAKEILRYFDAELFAEDIEHGKPNPEMFLKAAQRLGFVSDDCVVFEDAESGVKAAKAGGFLCVARDNGFGQDLSGADLVIQEFDPPALLTYVRSK